MPKTFERLVLAGGLMAALAGCGLAPQAPTADVPVTADAQSVRGPVMAGSYPIYFNGDNCYAALHQLIDQASESIFIETFNFSMGPADKALCDHLIARSRQGVKVRVLIDQVGNFWEVQANRGVPAYLKAAGIELQIYKTRNLGGTDGLNITHRKLYLADGWKGLTGGMNLTQEFHDARHDLLVQFTGDNVAQALHQEFVRDWKAAGGAAFTLPTRTYAPSSNQVAVTSPQEQRFEIRDALYGAVDRAQRLVQVESPYLSDDGLIDRLKAARKRGVAVQILFPGANSSQAFKLLNTEAANQLIRLGATLRNYTQRFNHTKYFAVDGTWAMFGSANGDNRAMRLNQELSVLVRDPALLATLDQTLFQHDWATAAPVTAFPDAPWYHHALTSILELIDYYL